MPPSPARTPLAGLCEPPAPVTIRIGTCGYRYYDPGEDWRDTYESKLRAYSDDVFDLVELNTTFYSLPEVATTERWREEAIEGFEFSLKAWQALTHTNRSPTWHGEREGLTDEQKEHFGYLEPHEVIFDAWAETKARADALDAAVCVVQTPASFDCTDEHESNLREFVGEIDRGDHVLGWEPRGDWKENPGRVEDICDDLDLVHIVDLLRHGPVSSHEVTYVRLHGLNEDPDDYDYDYSTSELEDLAGKLDDLDEAHDPVYCLFNNHAKFENARELADML